MQRLIPNPLQRSTDNSSSSPIIIAFVVLIGVALTAFVIFLTRALCYRYQLRGLNPTLHPTNSSLPSHQATYSSPQSPAFVRLQRLAQTSGLTVSELSQVAPVTPFEKQQEEEDTCPVCLDDMHQQSKNRRLPCHHAFDAQYVLFSPLSIQQDTLEMQKEKKEENWRLALFLFTNSFNLIDFAVYPHP